MDDNGAMRRRNVDGSLLDQEGSSGRHRPSWAEKVQTADIFTKIGKEYTEDVADYTSLGGIVSLICYVVMGILFVTETSGFLFATRSEHLKVDTSRSSIIEIYFHLTFPAICCADAHVDSMDVTGEQQVNVVHSIYKTRLDPAGNPIGREFIDKDMAPKMYIQMPGIGLMSLVGTDHRIGEQRGQREGCTLRGTLHVNKVEGNFHIAVGRSHKAQGHHVHNFRMSDLPFFNTSHTIHDLTFGPRYSGQMESALKGWTRHVAPSEDEDAIVSALYQYHIQLTPIVYKSSLGSVVQTNQITARDFDRRLDFSKPEHVSGMPGIFFQYKFSPFMVAIDDRRTSLVTYFTNVCAIIGGVFAVSSMFNAAIHRMRPLIAGRSKQSTGLL